MPRKAVKRGNDTKASTCEKVKILQRNISEKIRPQKGRQNITFLQLVQKCRTKLQSRKKGQISANSKFPQMRARSLRQFREAEGKMTNKTRKKVQTSKTVRLIYYKTPQRKTDML